MSHTPATVTDRERHEETARNCFGAVWEDVPGADRDFIVDRIAQALADAVAAERERNADIVARIVATMMKEAIGLRGADKDFAMTALQALAVIEQGIRAGRAKG